MDNTLRRRATDMLSNNMTDSERMIIIQNKVLEQDALLSKHHKVLIEGNGELPLVEKVRNLQVFVDSIKFWIRTVAVALVLQTITFGAAALVYFIKLYPILQKISQQP